MSYTPPSRLDLNVGFWDSPYDASGDVTFGEYFPPVIVVEQGSGVLLVQGSGTDVVTLVDVVSSIGVPDFSTPSVEEIALTIVVSGTGGPVISGEAKLGLEVVLYGSGGALVGGSGLDVLAVPNYYTEQGSGGALVLGTAGLEIVNPSINVEQSSGGIRVTGQHELKIEDMIVLEGSGTVKVLGSAVVVAFNPATYTEQGSDGIRITGTAGYDEHLAYVATEVGSGGVRMGASVELRIEDTIVLTGSGGPVVNGTNTLIPFVPTFHVDVAEPVLYVRGSVIFDYFLAPFVLEIGSGGLLINGTAEVKDERTYTLAGSGGPVIGGTGLDVATSPDFHAVTAVPLLRVLGTAAVDTFVPEIVAEAGSGGLMIQGGSTLRTEKVFYHTGSGGPRINGTYTVETFVPEIVSDAGTGGLIVSGSSTDLLELAPVVNLYGTGGLILSGIAELHVEKVFYLTGSGNIRIASAATVEAFNPVFHTEQGSGGVLVQGNNVPTVVMAPVFVETGTCGILVQGSGETVVESVLYGSGVVRIINSSTRVAFVPTFYNEQPIGNTVRIQGAAAVDTFVPNIKVVSGTGGVRIIPEVEKVVETVLYGLAGIRILSNTSLAIVNPIDVVEQPAAAGCRILGSANMSYFAPTWHLPVGTGGVKVRGEYETTFIGTRVLEGSGNVKVLGTHVYDEYLSPITYLSGTGGVLVNGSYTIEVFEAPVSRLEGTGGVLVNGDSTHKFIDVSVEYAYPDLVVGGTAIHSKTIPNYHIVSGSGGAKVKGNAVDKLVYTMFLTGTGGIKINKNLSATNIFAPPNWYTSVGTGGILVNGTADLGFLGTIYESGTGGAKVLGTAGITMFRPTFHTIAAQPLLKVRGSHTKVFVDIVLKSGTGGLKVSGSYSMVTEEGSEVGTGGVKVNGWHTSSLVASNVRFVGSGGVKINKNLSAVNSRYVSTRKYTGSGNIKINKNLSAGFDKYVALATSVASGGIKVNGWHLDGTINTFVEPQLGAMLTIKVRGTAPNSIVRPAWHIRSGTGGIKINGVAKFAEDRIEFVGTGGLKIGKNTSAISVMEPGPPPKVLVAIPGRIRVRGYCNYSLPIEWTEISPAASISSIIMDGRHEVHGGPSLTWSHASMGRIKIRGTAVHSQPPNPPIPNIYVEYGSRGYWWENRIQMEGGYGIKTNPIVISGAANVRISKWGLGANVVFKPAINTEYGSGGLKVNHRGYRELWASVRYNPIVERSEGEDYGIKVWRFSIAFFKVPNIHKHTVLAALNVRGQAAVAVFKQPNREIDLPNSRANIQIAGTALIKTENPFILGYRSANSILVNGAARYGYGDPSLFTIQGADVRVRVRYASIVKTFSPGGGGSGGGGSGGGGSGGGGSGGTIVRHNLRIRVRGHAQVSVTNVHSGYWWWDGGKWLWKGPIQNTVWVRGSCNIVVGKYDSAIHDKWEKIFIISGYTPLTLLGYGRTKMNRPNRYDEMSILDDPLAAGAKISSSSVVEFIPG